MATQHQHPPAEPALPSALPNQPLRRDSAELLQGRNTLEINHGGQRYLLRVTRENKLILTK